MVDLGGSLLLTGTLATWEEEGTGRGARWAGRVLNYWWKLGLGLIAVAIVWAVLTSDGGRSSSGGGDPYDGPLGTRDYTEPFAPTPSSYPPGGDLDCSDFDGPVAVGTDDPSGLDADGDGIGCVPYP